MSARARVSAGLLPYRIREGRLEVMLVHPGGPFFAKKDQGAWSIPKGEIEEGEELLPAAERELFEETGFVAHGPFLALGSVRQKSGKLVHAWAFEADFDTAALKSNGFELEWPPRSGRRARFPEVDRAAWLDPKAAQSKINPAQIPLLEALERQLGRRSE